MKPNDPAHRRWFGIAVATALTMFAWMTWRAFASPWLSGSLLAAGVAISLVYYLFPTLQPQLITFFHGITYPIRWTMTLVVLGIVYYVVLTPISIWFRWKGKSIRVTPADADSNWRPIEVATDPESYFRTF